MRAMKISKIVAGLMAVLMGAVAGGAIVRDSIATDCQERGRFLEKDRVFECHIERK